MTRIELVDLIRFVEEIPPLSPTHQRIARLMGREDSTVDQIAAAVSEDPHLPTRVLAVANAKPHPSRAPITSLVRAIVTIGFAGVQSLLMSSAAIASLRHYAGPGVTALWHRSFAAGLAARELAQRLRLLDPEEAFMLGQLQHLGQILFWARYPKPYAEALGRLAAGGKTDVVTVEREAFGVTHQEVGYLLARRLALPEAVVQVIYHHHEPEAAGSFQPRAVLVHVADVLACALGCGSDGDPYVRPLKIKKETLAALGLTMEDVEPVCEAVLLGFKDFDAYHASV